MPFDLSFGWRLIVFIGLMFMTACIGLAAFLRGMRIFGEQDSKEARQAAMELAARICGTPQRVRNNKWHRPPKGMLDLELRANSEEMQEARLLFPQKHPDFKELVHIQQFSQIEFELQKEPIKGVEPQDAIAYLRLKK